MFELGNQSEKEHHDLIDFCVKNNFENIFLIGNEFFKQKDKFQIPFFYKTKDELNNHIKKFPITSKYVLIKGSRGMKMEDLSKFYLIIMKKTILFFFISVLIGCNNPSSVEKL